MLQGYDRRPDGRDRGAYTDRVSMALNIEPIQA